MAKIFLGHSSTSRLESDNNVNLRHFLLIFRQILEIMAVIFDLNRIKKLKAKLLFQYAIVTMFTFLLVLICLFSYKKISRANEANAVIQELHLQANELQAEINLFTQMDLGNDSLYQFGNTHHIAKFKAADQSMKNRLEQLISDPIMEQLGFSDSMRTVKVNLYEYNKAFEQLVIKYRLRGVKDWGVQGELNKALQALESGGGPLDKDYVLQLRRQVEAFNNRRDVSALRIVDITADDFKNNTQDKELPGLIENFVIAFHKFADAETQIGLNQNSGIRGDLNTIYLHTGPIIERMNKRSKEYVDEVILYCIFIVIGFFMLQLVLVIIFANVFANSIVSSIQKIKNAIKELSEGKFPEQIHIQQQDEVGEISEGFNNIVERMQVASGFSEKIGNGELNVHYDAKFNNDVLAKSLTKMHEKLLQVTRENDKRNWVNQGLAQFSAVIRDTSNADAFYDNVLNNIMRYLHANQGYLYIMNDDNEKEAFFELKAVYAYGKKRYLEEKQVVYFKQGLIGQAWFDKEPLYFTEIPKDYVRITSGVGEATPRNIFICPLMYNEIVFGAIEIATFEPLVDHEMEFVKKVSESIASTVSAVKVNEKTKGLLQQSQQQTEELRAQEEETRQNLEEMNATTEHMEVKERELKKMLIKFEEKEKSYKALEAQFKEMQANTSEQFMQIVDLRKQLKLKEEELNKLKNG